MPYAPSLPTAATVKVARKDVVRESCSSLSILQGEEYSRSVRCLNEIVVDFLGDYNALSEPKPQTPDCNTEITTTPRSHEPEDSGFRLFSWSTTTQPIELTRLCQPKPRTTHVSYEDTDDEAKRRAERAKEISIEGVEVLRDPKYPSPFQRNYTPECMKPVASCNFKPPNLMVAKKEGLAIYETSVLFPRTKCCAVIPVKSLENKFKKKRRRKRKHTHEFRQQKLHTMEKGLPGWKASRDVARLK